MMKPWMWWVLGGIVVIVIAYAIYANNQSKKAEAAAKLKEEQLDALNNPNNTPRSSKLAEILDALVPFLQLV